MTYRVCTHHIKLSLKTHDTSENVLPEIIAHRVTGIFCAILQNNIKCYMSYVLNGKCFRDFNNVR